MTETPTPLMFKNAGAGWHLRPRRRLLFLGGALLVAAGLAAAGVSVLADGKVLGAVLLGVFAAAFAALPFGTTRRRLAPSTYDGPEGRGTLLPVHAVRVVTIGAMTVFGLLLMLAPVMALDEGRDDGAGELAVSLAVSLFVFLMGLLLLAGAYGGVRSRLTPSKGILLTPTRIVLRTQAEPMSFDWEVLRGVWPHWTRSRTKMDLIPSPEDPIHNWLSFEVVPGRFEGSNALGGMAGTADPTLDAEKVASGPEAVLAFCRHYLAHPEARAELGTEAALARFRDLAAGT